MYAHTDEHVEQYLAAVHEIFPIIAKAIEEGNVESMLNGPVAHAGFHRLT
jgi:glutamate-1-semialdehyde 2,1-aminomutase